MELRTAYIRASEVFANAPSSLRQEILRSMIYEANFHIAPEGSEKTERMDNFSV